MGKFVYIPAFNQRYSLLDITRTLRNTVVAYAEVIV